MSCRRVHSIFPCLKLSSMRFYIHTFFLSIVRFTKAGYWHKHSVRTLMIVGGFLCFFLSNTIYAQTCKDASVELRADVQLDPPRISLNWSSHPDATNYIIYRKLKSGNSWGNVVANLSGVTTQFVDSTVSKNISYEYRVSKLGSSVSGFGYINAGIEVAAIEFRGIIILIIDDTMVDSLSEEIAMLVSDLEGDGWKVRMQAVSREADVTSVKEEIVNIYNQEPTDTKAVYLLGRIPVPYSGDIYPDGHPDHEGAWPADVYYGDMNGIWTDNSVNVVVASAERHRNIPEDGKFDQSLLPGDIELQVGRVDFANMPEFADSEVKLLRNYLNKSHAYKHKLFSAKRRAVIDDNFGYFSGEAFAASGWKNFGPLCGPEAVQAGDYFMTTMDSSYLWAYGCGGGSYTSAGGIGNTNNFAAANLQSVFSMLFGSYFGDWDATNNFLRAPLAQGTTLTNAWSGRPHWMFHHMGLGENIGYSTRLTQNNSGLYYFSYGARFIHIALMGDPSLRNDVVAPVEAVVANRMEDGAEVLWQPSSDAVEGYYIYAKSEQAPDYVRLNDELITSTNYLVPCLYDEGVYSFMVRAVSLQTSPSGTYFNLSQGITDTLMSNGITEADALMDWVVAGSEVGFTNLSTNATSYEWNFGDGMISAEENPTHVYLDGFFSGFLVASNACSADTFYFDINIATSLNYIKDDPSISVSPSPSAGLVTIKWIGDSQSTIGVTMYAIDGTKMYSNQVVTNGATLDFSLFPAGMYLMHVLKDGVASIKRVMLE